MASPRTASILAWAAAALYVGTAAWHQTGLSFVQRLTADGPEGLQPLISALWILFGVSLVILALIIAACASTTHPARRLILGLAALGPVSGAILQIAYLGFIPPTALLLIDAAVAATAALATPRHTA